MPGIRMEGLRELREYLEKIAKPNDRKLANAVHSAIIEQMKAANIPVSGKMYSWPVQGQKLSPPAPGWRAAAAGEQEWASGPRNIEAGSLKRALLNRKDRNHVWRWNKGKFSYGVKGGPQYGETAQTGIKDRKDRSGKSRGPKANVPRAMRFQGPKISASVDRTWPLIKKAILNVMLERK